MCNLQLSRHCTIKLTAVNEMYEKNCGGNKFAEIIIPAKLKFDGRTAINWFECQSACTKISAGLPDVGNFFTLRPIQRTLIWYFHRNWMDPLFHFITLNLCCLTTIWESFRSLRKSSFQFIILTTNNINNNSLRLNLWLFVQYSMYLCMFKIFIVYITIWFPRCKYNFYANPSTFWHNHSIKLSCERFNC